MPRGVELPTTYAELQAVKDRIQILIPNEEYLVLDNDVLIAIASGEDAGRIEMNGETLDPMYEDTDNETIWGFFECADAEQPVITEEVKEPTYVTWTKNDAFKAGYYIPNQTLESITEYFEDNDLTLDTSNLWHNIPNITNLNVYRFTDTMATNLGGTKLETTGQKVKTNSDGVFIVKNTKQVSKKYPVTITPNIDDLNYIITLSNTKLSGTFYNPTTTDLKELVTNIGYIIEVPKLSNFDTKDKIENTSYNDVSDWPNLLINIDESFNGYEFYEGINSNFSFAITKSDESGTYKCATFTNGNVLSDNLVENNVLTASNGVTYSTPIIIIGDNIKELYRNKKIGLKVNNIVFPLNQDPKPFDGYGYNQDNALYDEQNNTIVKTLNSKEFIVIKVNYELARIPDLASADFNPNEDFTFVLLD